MVTPSGEGQDPVSFNVENREPSNAFKCSRCGQNISFVSAQGIERVTQIIQNHLEQCLRSRSLQSFFNSSLARNNIDPLDLLMPLQPRRTWSAEDDRRRRLEADPDAYDVGPHTVTCRGCHRPIRLNATGRYYAANWNKHKMGCKIANSQDGGGSASLQSKFTGRVAAFRVSNPTGEGSDTSLHSPTSIPATSSDSSSPRSPMRNSRQPIQEFEERNPSPWSSQSLESSRSSTGNSPFQPRAIHRNVDLRSSPAGSFAQTQASQFRSPAISSHDLSQAPHPLGSVPRQPALNSSVSTSFSSGEHEGRTYRASIGPFNSQPHMHSSSGVPRVEDLSLTSGPDTRSIRRKQWGSGLTNQLTGAGSRLMRDDSSRVGLSLSRAPQLSGGMAASSQASQLQTPIRAGSAGASSFRSSHPTITDSSSSSASSSPIPAATTLDMSRRRLSSSGNFTHHSAVSIPIYQVGNRLQTSGGLENRLDLGSPHYSSSSAHIPTRFASNEPPYSDNKSASSSLLPGTSIPSSSASISRGGNDSGQILPSLSHITRDLPHPGRLLDAVGMRGPSRSTNSGSQDRFRSSPAMGRSPMSSSLILPPLRMPPGSSSFNKRQFENETGMDRDSPSPKKSSIPLGDRYRGTHPGQSSRASPAPLQRGQSVSSPPNPDFVRSERGSIRDTLRPPASQAYTSQAAIPLEDNREQLAARLHPVWKWEKGKAVALDPEPRSQNQGDPDSDNEMDT